MLPSSTAAMRFMAKANLRNVNNLRRYSTVTATKLQPEVQKWEDAKPFELIPGPKPLPIVGNAWRFLLGVDFLKMTDEMTKKYGEIIIMRQLTGLGDLLSILNVHDIEWLLRNEGPWPKRTAMPSSVFYRHTVRKDIFGDTHGLINGQDEQWGTFRTAVNPIMMQPRITHQYIPQINEIADEFIQHIHRLQSQSDKREMPDDFVDEINKWSFESIAAIALDTRLGVLAEKPSQKAEQAMRHIMESFKLMFKLDFMPTGKLHMKYNTPTFKKFVRICDFFTNMCLELIDEAETKIKNDPNYAQKEEHEKSVFEKLVAKDRKIAMVMILDMLQAGVDTTGKIVGATLYFLAKSPQSQEKLRNELKHLLAHKNSPITKEILDEAKYLRAVIKEALRLAPIGVGMMRITTKPIVLGGYQIPVGTMISVPNLYLSKGTDKYFNNPADFNPERWLREERESKSESVNGFVSLPFGFGARSCIGKRMATMEIEVVIAKMIRTFALEWNYKDMTFKQDLLYGIGDPLKLKITDVSD